MTQVPVSEKVLDQFVRPDCSRSNSTRILDPGGIQNCGVIFDQHGGKSLQSAQWSPNIMSNAVTEALEGFHALLQLGRALGNSVFKFIRMLRQSISGCLQFILSSLPLFDLCLQLFGAGAKFSRRRLQFFVICTQQVDQDRARTRREQVEEYLERLDPGMRAKGRQRR